LKTRPTILPSVSFTLEIVSMSWKRSFLTTSSCYMWQNALSMMKETLWTGVWNTFHRDMNKTYSLRHVGSGRPSIDHAVPDTQTLQHRFKDSWAHAPREVMSLSISITSLSLSHSDITRLSVTPAGYCSVCFFSLYRL
jgi:hypothetical protein